MILVEMHHQPRNTKKTCEICSKLTIKTPEWRYLRHSSSSGVFIVNFEHIHTFPGVFIIDFEQVNVSWEVESCHMQKRWRLFLYLVIGDICQTYLKERCFSSTQACRRSCICIQYEREIILRRTWRYKNLKSLSNLWL